jgi:hypothetical protein
LNLPFFFSCCFCHVVASIAVLTSIAWLLPTTGNRVPHFLLLPSPSRAAATATSSAKKSLPPSKKVATKSLSTLGFSSLKRPLVPIGTKVLLEDSIYPRGQRLPGVKEHMFVYEVVQWNQNSTIAKVQDINQVIRQGGDKYQVYKEGNDVQVQIDC